MNKLLILLSTVLLFSCNNKETKGKFTVKAEITNGADQKVYLEEIPFTSGAPLLLDTTHMKDGKFSLSSTATQEGLYRLRFDNGMAFLFINDADKINFTTDLAAKDRQTPVFNSPANLSFKNFVTQNETMRAALQKEAAAIDTMKKNNASDSLMKPEQKKFDGQISDYEHFVLSYADTAKSPIVSLFALLFSQNIKPDALTPVLDNLVKRFPEHDIVKQAVANYKMDLAKQYGGQSVAPNGMAPEITMPDTAGKPFSLSSLRGKYVLVDFWASWCGPCRGENPNVVAAYKKYKDKNFTVLGVSLDKEKEPWLKAIKDDGLTWNHISDLKYWNSAAVSLYGFEAIPYNVLVDPQGKIIASELRGDDLQKKLAEVLK